MIFPFTWTYSKCRNTENGDENDQNFPRIDEDSSSPRNSAVQLAIQESVEQFIFELQLQEIARIHGETSESISSDIPTTSNNPPYQENPAFSLSVMSEYAKSSSITSSSRSSGISGFSVVIDEIQIALNRNRFFNPEIATRSRTSSESSLSNQENTNSEAGLCKITKSGLDLDGFIREIGKRQKSFDLR